MSYAIYVGKNHSRDGHAWLAGYGDEPSSHWLEIIPRKTHEQGTSITVGVTEQADLPGRLTEIPQASETCRHTRVSYSHYKGVPAPLTNGGLNEYGVAIRDIWSPSCQELVDMTPADQTGFNYSDLARCAIERAHTARGAVELMGQLIADHGEATYGGNSHLIADPDEAWVVIRFAGGLGLWCAERLGADDIRASRPGYIGEIPLDDASSDRVMHSPNFIDFAIEQGWFDPASGAPFDINTIYGDGKFRWSGVQWIEGEMRARATRPEKVGMEDMIWTIRTEKLTGDTAGYGQVVPLTHPSYYALRVLWHAPIGALAAPLVPVYLGCTEVPVEFRMHRYLTSGESARFLDTRHSALTRDVATVSQAPQGIESLAPQSTSTSALCILCCCIRTVSLAR